MLKQAIEIRFDSAPGHIQLRGNFRISAALQEQIHNLLFASAQPDRFFHYPPFISGVGR